MPPPSHDVSHSAPNSPPKLPSLSQWSPPPKFCPVRPKLAGPKVRPYAADTPQGRTGGRGDEVRRADGVLRPESTPRPTVSAPGIPSAPTARRPSTPKPYGPELLPRPGGPPPPKFVVARSLLPS
uniref:Uncharacterized protein n=1 Tax=Arundo donax TaxID=35708 RepID=A0A0A9HB56_ARUDO